MEEKQSAFLREDRGADSTSCLQASLGVAWQGAPVRFSGFRSWSSSKPWCFPKSNLLAADKVKPTQVKVVTENGVV